MQTKKERKSKDSRLIGRTSAFPLEGPVLLEVSTLWAVKARITQ